MTYNSGNTIKILVTGSRGQLGQCIQLASQEFMNLEFQYRNSKDLDITDKLSVFDFFEGESFDYVINCAAYTNVEQAEKEPLKAFLVNAEGARNLAEVCEKYDITLIHISTDYVFDGKNEAPYTEKNAPNPINEYGKSKLKGEQNIEEIHKKHFIVRTSWLYSQFGKNFYKTILEKSNSQKEFTITIAEKGTPTNANGLAKFLLEIVEVGSKKYGIYHFSDLGSATWYDFAEQILKNLGKQDLIKLKKTDNYPTFVQRPKYSILNKQKIKRVFNTSVLCWRDSLRKL